MARRVVQVVLTLVLFTAAMEGVRFLAGDGISHEFGAAFVFGVMASAAVIALVVDRDDETFPRLAGLGALVGLAATAALVGGFLHKDPTNWHLLTGAFVGLGLGLPLLYWYVGEDRAGRGDPRQPLFHRASMRRRP